MNRNLDWVSRHDPRSLNYPVFAAGTPVVLRDRDWAPGQVLDQGQEGACVGFGWTGEALAAPVKVDLARVKAVNIPDGNAFARNAYHTAQTLDETPGENYEGTSVLAGAKTMVKFGLLKEYRWAFGIDDVAAALSAKGPVVLGINWYQDMYEAPNGILTVGGPLAGGHCILAHRYRLPGTIFKDEAAIGLQNSWGTSWGDQGRAWIRASALATLLKTNGEACVPVRRAFGY